MNCCRDQSEINAFFKMKIFLNRNIENVYGLKVLRLNNLTCEFTFEYSIYSILNPKIIVSRLHRCW